MKKFVWQNDFYDDSFLKETEKKAFLSCVTMLQKFYIGLLLLSKCEECI